jgi:hypothetical protein
VRYVGFIHTETDNAHWADNHLVVQGMDPQAREELMKQMAEKLLVKHVADADEIAEAVSLRFCWKEGWLTVPAQYLFAMKCKYFTGQSLIVDGGISLV